MARKRKMISADGPAKSAYDQAHPSVAPTPSEDTQTGLIVLQVPSPADISRARDEALSLSRPVLELVQSLSITDQESYLNADLVLDKIRFARTSIDGKLEPLIRPTRQGLDELYVLRRGFDNPLEEAERGVKRKMADFQLQENARLRRIQEENAAREREVKEAYEKAERERLRKEKEAREIEEFERSLDPGQAVDDERVGMPFPTTVPAHPAAAPVTVETWGPVTVTYLPPPPEPRAQGAHSRARTVKLWRITDLPAFIDGLSLGLIPPGPGAIYNLLVPNQTLLDELFTNDPNSFSTYPGVEVYEDVKISGR